MVSFMPILRAFLALLGGFVSMAVIVGVITAALTRFAPSWVSATGNPRPAYIAVNLTYSLIAAAVGGYVCAWIAASNPVGHALVLAIAILVLSGLTALQQRGLQPLGYQIALMAIAPIGVICGGLLRLKVLAG
jgi:hypothetical protein